MSPHDENWDLEPENGHPNARLLLSEPFYWDCTDDNSPLGNDTGADVLSFYSEAVADNPNTDPLKFLEELLGSWEMLIDDWEMTDPAKIRSQLKNDPDTIGISDEAVIGLAFAMLVIHGQADRRILDMAMTAVRRELTDELLDGWASPEERRQRLANFSTKLATMQVATE